MVKILVFGPIFADPRPRMDPKSPLKVGTCPGLPLQLISHNQSFQIIGFNQVILSRIKQM